MTVGSFNVGYTQSNVDQGGFFVRATVAGGPTHTFQVDSGSCGMIIGADYVPADLDSYPCFGPGSMHYLPSNNIRSGTWYYLPVSLYNGNTDQTIQSHCMVLVINDPAGFDGGMMGVAAQTSYPAYNVFLNAQDASGAPLKQSFALTPNAAVIGVDHTDSGFEGFNYVQLVAPTEIPLAPAQTNQVPMSWQSQPLWSPPIATLSIATPQTPEPVHTSASFMMDTGINQMLVVAPQDFIPAGVIDPTVQGQTPFTPNIGTHVTIDLQSTTGTTLLSYQFLVNAPPVTVPPEAPQDVVYLGHSVTPPGVAKVNVGIHPLRNHVYMYDYAAGLIGFAPVA